MVASSAREPQPRRESATHRPSDEEVVAAIVRVVLAESPVEGQHRLRKLVATALRAHDPKARVGGARVRRLALKSGLVGVHIAARRVHGATNLKRCPVCASAVKRSANRTLLGGETDAGVRCTRCPWWTSHRTLRVPRKYSFYAKLERARKGRQLTFR
ncbi:MAG: hypothetical protein ACYDCK_06925 [Thermoplasmatota archaeon]